MEIINITDYNKCFICLDIIEMEFNNSNKYIIILNNSNIENECNCKLSLHIHCLKEWIFSQCENNNTPYYIKCPICHKKLIITDFTTNDNTLFNHKYLTDKIIENWINEYKIQIKLKNDNETETIYYNNENISNIDFITDHPTYYVSCKNAIFCFSMTAITYFSFIIIKHLVN